MKKLTVSYRLYKILGNKKPLHCKGFLTQVTFMKAYEFYMVPRAGIEPARRSPAEGF